MNLQEYQDAAVLTAVYPAVYKIAYPALGLIGEGRELANELFVGLTQQPVRTDGIVKEAGDVCWYVAVLCRDLDIKLSELKSKTLSYVLPKPEYEMFDFSFFAEIAKRILRDGIDDDKIQKVKDYMVMVLCLVEALAISIGIPFDMVLETNLKKLALRKERGTLHGEGDNR